MSDGPSDGRDAFDRILQTVWCPAILLGRAEAETALRGALSRHGLRHKACPGRPSLASDLPEEFRPPFVGRFVLRFCNLRSHALDAVEADSQRPGGVRLTRKGLRTVLGK